MTLLGSWYRSLRANFEAREARALVESRTRTRLTELINQPYKSMSELLEMRQLFEGIGDLFGPSRVDWLKADLGRLMSFERGGRGVSGWTSKTGAKGAQPPLYQSEGELGLIRDASRIMVADYPKADGMIRNLAGYVFGDGATVQCKPRTPADADTAKRAQVVCDEFADRVVWEIMQEEFFCCSRRDGDAWLRTFALDDGRTDIRQIWPEQIRQPPGTDEDEWAYGVQTPIADKQTELAYAVFPTNGDELHDAWEEVPAEEMIGIKINVDAGVSRGIPDLTFGMMDVMKASQKLGGNMGAASAQQASIAFIRQHKGQPKSTIQSFVTADADFTRPNLYTGADIQVKEGIPGAIVDTNDFVEFKDSPYSGGIPGHIEVLKVLDRTACVKYGAPEWMINADASSNSYANALSQETPFVIRIKSFQRRYSRPFRMLFQRVLTNAAKAGLGGLPPDVLRHVEVKVTMPNPQIRDRLQEAQVGDIRLKNRTLSPQTFCEQQGDEWDKEQRNIKQAIADGWTPPATGPAQEKPADNNGVPKTSHDENGKPRQQAQPSQNGNGVPRAVAERLQSLAESEDAEGHEHKGKGPGGGQFTSKGGGRDHTARTKELQANQSDPSDEHVAAVMTHMADLAKLSKEQLRQLAADAKIEGVYPGSTKAQILLRIQNHLTVGARAQERAKV